MSDRYISKGVKNYVLERDDRECVYCGKGANGRIMSFLRRLFGLRARTIEFGHVIPNAQGGNECIENIQIECFSCNRSKGATERRRGWWDRMTGKTLEGCKGRCSHPK